MFKETIEDKKPDWLIEEEREQERFNRVQVDKNPFADKSSLNNTPNIDSLFAESEVHLKLYVDSVAKRIFEAISPEDESVFDFLDELEQLYLNTPIKSWYPMLTGEYWRDEVLQDYGFREVRRWPSESEARELMKESIESLILKQEDTALLVKWRRTLKHKYSNDEQGGFLSTLAEFVQAKKEMSSYRQKESTKITSRIFTAEGRNVLRHPMYHTVEIVDFDGISDPKAAEIRRVESWSNRFSEKQPPEWLKERQKR